MRSSIGAFLRRIARKVWARAALYTVVAILFALAAGFIGKLFPFRLVIDLGQDSVGSILEIIASSMLAVTTFSLTAMVTAYSSATTTATPRATQLLVEDTTAQNALSTFVGGFTFSLVGIIALSTGYYGDQGRTILFLGTLMMIAVIVITLLHWIAHLSTFGRMADIIDRVEAAAAHTLTAYANTPTLGAQIAGGDREGFAVHSTRTGYVTFIDLRALENIAEKADTTVHLIAIPGRMADTITPLILVGRRVDDAAQESIRRAFRIEPHRTYEQDPRLGVIALSEIGSRALSPSTNDPGTAIEVLAALQRVFTAMLAVEYDDEITYSHIRMTPVTLEDLIVDAFRPIARDGAGHIEVQVRLQKTLKALAAAAPEHSTDFRASAENALLRGHEGLATSDDQQLRALFSELWK